MIPNYAKAMLKLAAIQKNTRLGIGIGSSCSREPFIQRKHIDGPYIHYLDGSVRWLTLWERLLTKVGYYDAWDLELFRFAESPQS